MEKGNALALLPVPKHAALSLSQVACFVGLRGSSQSSLTAGTCGGSEHLVSDSLWLNTRTGIHCLVLQPSQCCARDAQGLRRPERSAKKR